MWTENLVSVGCCLQRFEEIRKTEFEIQTKCPMERMLKGFKGYKLFAKLSNQCIFPFFSLNRPFGSKFTCQYFADQALHCVGSQKYLQMLLQSSHCCICLTVRYDAPPRGPVLP